VPEGFPAAGYFDTYWGDLATVGDWSEAQPLQCGFPTSQPAVGDYLEVEDPLPALEVGHGRYYVTAVSYQGQRRYGRKRNGGVLSGRDSALLPGCGESRASFSDPSVLLETRPFQAPFPPPIHRPLVVYELQRSRR